MIVAVISNVKKENFIQNVNIVAQSSSEESITIPENEKEEIQKNEERVVASTSRSGAVTPRTKRSVYYEKIDLNLTEDEIEIFERIVEAEVGGDNYDGKLAVANVILNRVKSERFPNTIEEVVFARRQFSPVGDGRYYKVTVSDMTKQVVADALAGGRIVGEDAFYFCTPTAPGRGWFETDLRKIDYIAPHNIYGYKEN